MSPPQPSSRSEPSSSGPNPASLEEQRNPDRRAGLQANQIENSATTLAWRRARDTYRTTLTDKEFKRIMIPVGPDDVLKEIEKWQNRQRKSKFSKVADGVQAGVSHLQKFNRAVDLIAQGTPAPGCLIWGSVLFALTIVQSAAEEYLKLCKALTRMTECLPWIERYTDTFLHSSLIQACVSDFYGSVLRFWTKACKFYRRSRLLNFGRVIWNDYDAEFGELEVDMVRCWERVKDSATAEFIGESTAATNQQNTMLTSLLEAQSSSKQKEIIAWLAPIRNTIEYYMDDFEQAKEARHDGSCEWLLTHEAFVRFNQVIDSAWSFLWIYAQPGAGKTVLAAFIVDHLAFRRQSGCVLFFFCKEADDDKRTSIAIARSLLYQLFHTLRQRAMESALMKEISLAVQESGHKNALNFTTVWRILSKHISDIASAAIVIDALDECRDSEVLIQSLRSMANLRNISVILTSRKEEHLYQLLHKYPSLEIGPNDTDADIKAFVKAKVAASPRLSQPSVRNLVIKRLCESHEGMFLWVHYMLRELKSCVSLEQVQEDLRELPRGLNAVYQRILQRLQDTLNKHSLELCSKVLTWVITSLRPLRIDELRQALESHYLQDGHSLLSAEGLFPYSDKDIELVCGSLVAVRNETLQVVHLTVTQYIKSLSSPTALRLPADVEDANLQLALTCLSFIKQSCTEPIVKLFPKRPLKIDADDLDLSRLRFNKPFLDYACFSWMIHLLKCSSVEAGKAAEFFYGTFDSPSTFGWVESCISLRPGSIFRLSIGLEDVRDWIHSLHLNEILAGDSSFSFVSNWCAAMEQVLKEYAPMLKRRPAEVYYLDFAVIFGTHGLAKTYEKYGNLMRREKSFRFPIDRVPWPARKEVPPSRQLPDQSEFEGNRLGLVIYDPNRDIYIMGLMDFEYGRLTLLAQSASSGRRLPPVSGKATPPGRNDRSVLWIRSYAMSWDGRYLGIVSEVISSTRSSLEIWEIDETLDFNNRTQTLPWARRIYVLAPDEPRLGSIWYHPRIAFDRDGVCCTPHGLVRTSLETNTCIEAGPLQQLAEMLHHEHSAFDRAFYSGNGNFLFVSSDTKIMKYSFPDLEVHFEMSMLDTKRYALTASPSGRYLALVARSQRRTASDLSLLVDTLSRTTKAFPHSPDLTPMEEDHFFHFSVDEKEFLACYVSYSNVPATIYVQCYAGLPGDFRLRTSGKCVYRSLRLPVGAYVSDDHRNLRAVTYAGEILRFKLGDRIELVDVPDEPSEYPFRAIFLSRDGSQWASVYYGKDRAQVQIHEMFNPNEAPRCIELQRSSSVSDGETPYITMNMDLSLLVLDGDIYRIADVTEAQPTIPKALELSKEVFLTPRVTTTPSPRCSIDSSNSYVVYVKQNRSFGQKPLIPDVLAMFHMDSNKNTSLRPHVLLPEDMYDISAAFHPSTPFLIIGFGLISEARDVPSNYSPVPEHERSPYHVILIDLNTMKGVADVEPNPSFSTQSNAHWRPEVVFSDSGEFAYIQFGPHDSLQPRIHHRFVISPSTCRYLEDVLVVDGAFYHTHRDMGSITLGLTKPMPVRGLQQRNVRLDDLVQFTALHPQSGQVFLVLGKTDKDYMHALVIPHRNYAPELKEIPLSWADVRALLERKWELEYGRMTRRYIIKRI